MLGRERERLMLMIKFAREPMSKPNHDPDITTQTRHMDDDLTVRNTDNYVDVNESDSP